MLSFVKNLLTRPSSAPAEKAEEVAHRLTDAFSSGDYAQARRIMSETKIEGAAERIYSLHTKPMPEKFNNAFALFEHMAPNNPDILEHFDRVFEGDIMTPSRMDLGVSHNDGAIFTKVRAESPFEALHLDTGYTVVEPAVGEIRGYFEQLVDGEITVDQMHEKASNVQDKLRGQIQTFQDCYKHRSKWGGGVKCQYELGEQVKNADNILYGYKEHIDAGLTHENAFAILHPAVYDKIDSAKTRKDIEYMAEKIPKTPMEIAKQQVEKQVPVYTADDLWNLNPEGEHVGNLALQAVPPPLKGSREL